MDADAQGVMDERQHIWNGGFQQFRIGMEISATN